MAGVHVPRTAEVVAQAIRTRIVRGEVARGAALPTEAALMNEFDVSRASLREAFRILETEQLITIRRGAQGGARVTHPDVTVAARYVGLLMQTEGVLLSDVFQARALIEPIAMKMLAHNPERETATQRLLAVLDRFTPGATARERANIWLDFFLLLFDLAGNKTLKLLYGALTEVLREELVDSMSEATAGRRQSTAIKTAAKALGLVADGKGDEAAEFWQNQMFLVEKTVSRRHRDKTMVDVMTNGR